MTLAECERLLREIETACRRDGDLQGLYEDLRFNAIRYARMRVDWYMLISDRRCDLDEARTRSHDAFIDSCNALSRAMGGRDLDNGWRNQIGYTREAIGDFACCLHAVLGLRAR